MNIFSRGATGFCSQAKCFELKFLMRKFSPGLLNQGGGGGGAK